MIVVLFILLLTGLWIGFALGMTGIFGLAVLQNWKAFEAIGRIAWNSTNSFEMTAIPLFVLMGELILHSGLSDVFYRSAAIWFGRLPGGLLQTNIISSSIFAAMSGSSPATAAAVGSVAYPQLSRQGYDKGLTVGTLAGGGALGILIPPSVIMIIYGSVASVSVEKLFMAGVVPGIVAAIFMMIYVGARCLMNPELVGEIPPKQSFLVMFKALVGMLPIFFLILIVLGGIYFGLTTPTEAAAIGAVGALFLSFVTKGLTWENFKTSVSATVRISSMIMFVVIGSQLLSYLFVMSGANRGLTEWVIQLQPSVYLFIALMTVVYVILGCMMCGISMIFMTVPILLPIMTGLNMDLIWFGIILTILIEMAQITPPVGLNIFVLAGITEGDCPLNTIIASVVPYCLIFMLMVFLVTVLPDLALWLPNHMVAR